MMGIRASRGVVERLLVDGSEAGEGFADLSSSKMETAEGDTTTAMKTKMIKGMNPRDIHQAYIFDHLEAQAVSHFLPQNRHFPFYELKPSANNRHPARIFLYRYNLSGIYGRSGSLIPKGETTLTVWRQ